MSSTDEVNVTSIAVQVEYRLQHTRTSSLGVMVEYSIRYDLIGLDVVTGIPLVSKPVLGSLVADLVSKDVVAGISTVSKPTINQTHILTSQNAIADIPSVSKPSLTEVYNLTSQNAVTDISTVNKPTLAQTHALTSQNIVTDVPAVGKPMIPRISKTILVTPLSAGSVNTVQPELSFYATSPDGESLEYHVQVDTTSDFDTVNLIEVYSNVDAGFENTDTPLDTHPFNAGDEIKYTVQTELDNEETYYWRVRAGVGV